MKVRLRRIFRNERGISPILATLLLIVIAVAAIIVTYAWITTYMSGATTHAGVMLDVENVYWNSSENTTIIYVKNTGTSDAKVVRLWMGNTSDSLVEVTGDTDIGSGVVVPAGGSELKTIILHWPNSLASMWEPNKLYHFKIVPEVGEETYFTARTPQ